MQLELLASLISHDKKPQVEAGGYDCVLTNLINIVKSADDRIDVSYVYQNIVASRSMSKEGSRTHSLFTALIDAMKIKRTQYVPTYRDPLGMALGKY